MFMAVMKSSNKYCLSPPIPPCPPHPTDQLRQPMHLLRVHLLWHVAAVGPEPAKESDAAVNEPRSETGAGGIHELTLGITNAANDRMHPLKYLADASPPCTTCPS